MERPLTGSQSGDRSARRRSSDAIASSAGSIVAIAGISIERAGAFPALTEAAVDDLLGALPPAEPPGDVQLRWLEDLPPTARTGAVVAWPGLAVHPHGGGWLVSGDSASALMTNGGVTLFGDGAEVQRVLPFAVAAALHVHHRYVVHAALVSKDQQAFLVVGPTGTGKSTTAYSALLRGWDVRTDDLAVLHRDHHDIILADGFPRPLRVPAELTSAHAHRGSLDERDRASVAVAAPGPPLRIAGVVLLAWGDAAQTSITTADRSEVLDLLVRSCFAVTGAHAVRGWVSLAAELARGPVVRLALGNDTTTRTASSGRALDELLSTVVQ